MFLLTIFQRTLLCLKCDPPPARGSKSGIGIAVYSEVNFTKGLFMEKCFLLLIALSLSGCGPTIPNLTIDPSFQSQADEWNATYPSNPIGNIGINFETAVNESAIGEIVGECTDYGIYGKITVLQSFWLSADSGTRLELVFHELGHCVFHLKHNCNMTMVDSMNAPSSIMYPYVFDLGSYSDKAYYFNELGRDVSNCE